MSDPARSLEDTGRKVDDGLEQFEGSTDCHANQPEGEQQKPDEGLDNQRKQGQRPADNEKNTPEQEGEHNPKLSQQPDRMPST